MFICRFIQFIISKLTTNNNMTTNNTFKRETTIMMPESEPDAEQKVMIRRLVSVKITPTIIEEEYEHVSDESPFKRGITYYNPLIDQDQEQVIQRQVLKDPPPFKRGITYWNPLNIPQHERGWKPPDDDEKEKEEELGDGDDIRLPTLTTESGSIQCFHVSEESVKLTSNKWI